MEQDHRAASLQYWEETHRAQGYARDRIRVDDWLDRFADVIERTDKPVLDLGCGGGNDTLYLIEKGKQVIACDQSETAIANIQKNFPVLFIVRWRFYAKGYKDKYTITVTATVVEPESTAFFIPLMVYEADIDGMPETLYELPSIGAPSLQLPPGYEVKLYIHPNPKKQKTVMFTEKPRPFVNELSDPFNSLFFKLMGIGFLLAAVVLFKLSTMM